MRLPELPHIDLRLQRAQHHSLDNVVHTGMEAMHKVTRTLVARSSESSSSTCDGGDANSVCPEKSTNAGSGQTLPIILGSVIPIAFALVVLLFLHRRHVKKQRIEDANDPHKSLDFGVDMGAPSKRGKHGVPEMTVTDLGNGPTRPGHAQRGLSMDIDMSSPYLLPAGLQGSRGSIHSMSRSMQDVHDPYRPVAMIRDSSESHRPRNLDTSSTYSASTGHLSSNEKAGLMANAQKMAQTYPKRGESMSPQDSKSSEDFPSRQLHSNGRSVPPSRKTSLGSTEQSPVDVRQPPRVQSPPQAQTQMPSPPPEPPVQQQAPRSRSTSVSATRPPRKSSVSAGASRKSANHQHESSNNGDALAAPSVPIVNLPRDSDHDINPAMINAGRFSIDTPNPSQQYPVRQPNASSAMGLRPLPPDMPEDNPEIRANRIRSFYKEYFDDSRPNPAHGQYEEDYDASYTDGAIYDPGTGGFVMAAPNKPFAAPVGRRAMTPPPRGAPRPVDPHRRQMSTQSAGRGRARGRSGPAPPMPQKHLPPPKALQGLPTPHLLKDYDSVISSPIDFAPPASFRNMQNGSGPDTPTGVSRPYSPNVRAFNPLVTAYDDLQVIPSPHLLRKSGTFTSLDFAPPSRAWVGDTASDAGSIRSARSGISAMQMDAVRAGAYRVSRIPKEMVTTQDDLRAQLRPKMDLVSRA